MLFIMPSKAALLVDQKGFTFNFRALRQQTFSVLIDFEDLFLHKKVNIFQHQLVFKPNWKQEMLIPALIKILWTSCLFFSNDLDAFLAIPLIELHQSITILFDHRKQPGITHLEITSHDLLKYATILYKADSHQMFDFLIDFHLHVIDKSCVHYIRHLLWHLFDAHLLLLLNQLLPTLDLPSVP